MPTPQEIERDVLAERLFGALLGTMDLFAIYLGDRLGFYRALLDHGPLTSTDLATHTGTTERYAREWLEQQAVTGLITAEGDDATSRTFALPPGHADVLVDPDSLANMIGPARFMVSIGSVMPSLLAAFRSGEGIPYLDYGPDAREGQEGMTRPLFANLLADEWLPAVPDLANHFARNPTARVADVGCGAGWSSIAIARAFPGVRVDGYDLDAPSIALARQHASDLGVNDRVQFHVRDVGEPGVVGGYDLVCAFECIHDMSDPVSVLRSMRHLASPDGVVLIADERVADAFTAPGDEIERFMYGFSILHCLPVGLAETPSVGTGTVIRSDIMRRYAHEAGFRDVEILPIVHDWWRFYRLLA